jgi:enamine deaminase RidA (YjgF/YER057c/UK114 family)
MWMAAPSNRETHVFATDHRGYRASVLERVNPPSLAAPSGFSHAVRATGTTIFLAGQTGMDASGNIVNGGLVAQFERALANMLTALDAAGGTPAYLAKVTIYIVDVEAYRAAAREIGAVWRRLAGRDYPAMAGIGVARLWDAEALVEIEGIAVLP